MLADVLRDQQKPQIVEVSHRLAEALTLSMGGEPGEPPPPEEDVRFRMSGIGKLCARMYALALRDQFSLSPLELYDPEKRMCRRKHSLDDAPMVDGKKWCRKCAAEVGWIFGTGTAVHTQFQEEYLRSLGDVFQGWWKCKRCGLVHKGERLDGPLSHKWIPCPKRCKDEGCELSREQAWEEKEEWERIYLESRGLDGASFDYVELEFSIPELRLSGHCDGILDWNYWQVPDGEEPGDDPDQIETLEIKTISENGFQWVDPAEGQKARAEHILQLHGYFLGLSETPIRKGRVFYVSKSGGEMSQVLCEHEIPRDDAYVDSVRAEVERTIEGLKVVAEGRRLAILNAGDSEPDLKSIPVPDRLRACGKKSDKRTKFCPARDQCFAK